MTMQQLIKSVPARDGAGVNISRIAGQQLHGLMDPFLMVDEIKSDKQDDYMAGFPTHPHRGFETITYLLSGSMTHKDHLGNEKTMTDGGVQWMTTGKGILHSEMPAQSEGLFHGFQIWLNLPGELKMMAPAYRDLHDGQMTRIETSDMKLKLVTGELTLDGQLRKAEQATVSRTNPLIADLVLEAGASAELAVGRHHKLLIYVYEGSSSDIDTGQMAIYLPGETVLNAGNDGLRALVLAGEPLEEPVVQYGPFVMNTRQQIEQAIEDYNSGQFLS